MKLKRRAFVRTGAMASTALLLAPGCSTSTKSAANQIIKPRIGLGLYTVRDLMKADPLGTLKQVAAIGYKKVETYSYNGEDRLFGMTSKEIKSVLQDLDLEFTSGHMDPICFEERFERSLEFMIQSGQQYAVFPYLKEEERTLDRYKQVAQALNRCGEKAKGTGITVCYHNHDFEFATVEGQVPIELLMRETDPDLVKLELDLFWVTKANRKVAEVFEQFSGRVPLWHVKDMDNTPEKDFTEVGNGTIDYAGIFKLSDLAGMKHFFVEQDQSDDPMKSIEVSYNNLIERILV